MKKNNIKGQNINPTDGYFRERLQNSEVQAGSHIWENIESALDYADSRRFALYRDRAYKAAIALLLFLFISQSTYFIYTKQTESFQAYENNYSAHPQSEAFIQKFREFLNLTLTENIQTAYNSNFEGVNTENSSDVIAGTSQSSSTYSSTVSGSLLSSVADDRYRNLSDKSALMLLDEENIKKSGLQLDLIQSEVFMEDELISDAYLALLYGLIDNPLLPVLTDADKRRSRARYDRPQPYAEGFSFGFEIHGIHNWFERTQLPQSLESTMEYSFEGGSGSRYGASVGYDFTESMGVETGFFMSTHNFTLHGVQNKWEYTRDFRIDFIELPLLFRYKLSGFSYRMNQTHGITFKLGGTYNLFQGGQFDETQSIFDEKQVFKKHHAGIVGGVQYDVFIAQNLLLSLSTRFDMVKPLENAYFYQSNLSAGVSMRYFIPVQKIK